MIRLFTSTARLLRWLDIIEWVAQLLLYIARQYKRSDDAPQQANSL